MAAFRTFWNSPVGPKTTHFWGPIANLGFVVAVYRLNVNLKQTRMTLAPLETHALLIWLQLLWLDIISYHGSYLIVYCLGLVDTQKPPEMISGNMTGVMCIYSGLFMRFAWMVQPRNYLLLSCHASNEAVQLYQFSRWAKFQGYLGKKEPEKQQ